MTAGKVSVMTVSQFKALPPRERDALVAERVMGYKVVDDPLVLLNGVRYIHKIEVAWDHGAGFTGKGERWSERIGPLPLYSTDIAAAWQVVGLMVTQLDQDLYLRFANSVRFSSEGDWVARAHIAAIRICIAALLAMGAIVPDSQGGE